MNSFNLSIYSKIIIMVLFFIIIVVGILFIRNKYIYLKTKLQNKSLTTTNNDNIKKIADLNSKIDTLTKILDVDRKIFNFIRCINIPRVTQCKVVSDDGNTVCRSKQLNCNQYKLELENNPFINNRIKEITQN